MDQQERLEKKIDKVFEKIASIDVTLAKQHVSIDEHIRRTNILENDIRPIKAHVNRVEGALKVLGASSVIGALIKLCMVMMHG
jgi:hypothetical protein